MGAIHCFFSITLTQQLALSVGCLLCEQACSPEADFQTPYCKGWEFWTFTLHISLEQGEFGFCQEDAYDATHSVDYTGTFEHS